MTCGAPRVTKSSHAAESSAGSAAAINVLEGKTRSCARLLFPWQPSHLCAFSSSAAFCCIDELNGSCVAQRVPIASWKSYIVRGNVTDLARGSRRARPGSRRAGCRKSLRPSLKRCTQHAPSLQPPTSRLPAHFLFSCPQPPTSPRRRVADHQSYLEEQE